ncbi:MAG: transporter [Bdellovibrio sp. CG12_big_fil_rev_8_21_14_0_65_39_13]|nr:MAG: transporter [Bdellovibrio sp. CG22_combo_CG10-13_8_21_14_all_39_27]PIQ60216.1 MAG: transporter [Bdellovibrio sp. CG12_big_fil_rev_8_21_14_0_65_39_13]PIR32353.1 MAG: transporter [Bdellovibrio sp. CG11_big_fil_rev_8_21_14_0_20_39_38]PJB54491.1 MAG: MotA/TolQ/ExbB proton channel family protein [Bdellovibrio sp. CG_4_9_14_3_um_filter_39_7]
MEGSQVTSSLNSIALFMQSGGVFMWVIAILWAIGLAISLERFMKLAFKLDVDGPSFMNELQRYILSNDIQGAIRVCSGSVAVLPKVLKSGLKRASSNTEQIQNAIDATALEVIPKVELRLGYLQTIANISTLFGLLGTIQGLIESFSAVAAADPTQKAEILASGISKAMNTTFLGLLAAITITMLHSFLAAKSDKIISEIDEFSVKLLDLLGTKKEKGE